MLAAFAFFSATQTPRLAHVPWWEGELLKLKREGFLSGYPSTIHSPRPTGRSYRYDAAVKINTAVSNVLDTGAEWPRFVRGVASGEIESDLSAERKAWLRASEALPFLLREFDHELSALGVNVSQTQQDLVVARRRLLALPIPKSGEALTRFPDVPKHHWADDAIHRLRRQGILWGFPDGTFTGTR